MSRLQSTSPRPRTGPTGAPDLRAGFDRAITAHESRRGEALDRLAEPHLAAWRQGRLDDDSLRRNLAGLIAESDVPSVVARRLCTSGGRGYDARLHADLTEKLRTLLVDKMLPPSTAFDPRKAGSIRGWAWNLASSAAVYQRRDLRRFYERFQLLATGDDLTAVSGDRGATAPPPQATAQPGSDLWDPDTCDDVADAVVGLAKPDREMVHLQAEALLAGLGLPPLQRISQLADRERITSQLEEDPGLALRSLTTWMAAVAPRTPTSRPSPRSAGTPASASSPSSPSRPTSSTTTSCIPGPARQAEPVDTTLLDVWDQFTAEQAGKLTSCAGSQARREQIAHTVAMAAACPLPRPALKRIRTFVTAVVTAAGLRDDSVREVAAAYVESECEPVARRATMHADVPAVLERHQRLKDSFERHLAAVAALDSDLGGCPTEVREHLHRIAKEEGLLFGSPLRSSLQALHSPPVTAP